MTSEPIIRLKDVKVTYFPGKSNEVTAVKNVTLDIYRGEFVIFFGPSGCGKSTLLYSIAGLERHATGGIFVEGKDVVKMSDNDLEKHYQTTIGIIFQAFYLIPSLSVLQNVMMPQIAIGAEPEERKKKAEDLIKYFGVWHQASKFPTELSGGEQQRVAISRSLVNDPDIILADEPVGNLDSKSATDVLSLIQEMNKTKKKTVILVTHDPTHLDTADRVFYLKDAELIDMKVNKEPRIIKRQNTKSEEGTKKDKSSLELLAKTYSKGKETIDGLLLEYKAREVVLEALTGLSGDEISSIEERVQIMIKKGVNDKNELFKYLDKDLGSGGIGLDKRTAKTINEKVKNIVEELKVVEKPNDKVIHPMDEFVKQIRTYLIEEFDIKIKSTDTIEVIESVIKDRVQGLTDRKGVFSALDLDIKEGGAGLDRRDAKKAAKRLELILLGAYVSDEKKEAKIIKKDTKK